MGFLLITDSIENTIQSLDSEVKFYENAYEQFEEQHTLEKLTYYQDKLYVLVN